MKKIKLVRLPTFFHPKKSIRKLIAQKSSQLLISNSNGKTSWTLPGTLARGGGGGREGDPKDLAIQRLVSQASRIWGHEGGFELTRLLGVKRISNFGSKMELVTFS